MNLSWLGIISSILKYLSCNQLLLTNLIVSIASIVLVFAMNPTCIAFSPTFFSATLLSLLRSPEWFLAYMHIIYILQVFNIC